MAIPATLSPLVNHIKATPIIGMEYILSYDKPNGTYVDAAGIYGATYATGITNKLIAADQFANNLRLKLKGENVSGGTVFGFGTIEAYYRKFSDSGTAIIGLDLTGNSGDTRTLTDFSLPGAQNLSGISIQIGSDVNFDNSTTIFYNTDTDTTTFSGSRTMEQYDKVWVKVTLKKVNDTSPAIPSINIKYEVT